MQRCVDRLVREKIARTESRAEQTVQLAMDIKDGTKEIQADTRSIKEDSAISRTGIAHMGASQAVFIQQIREMQKSMETLLQESSRQRECKDHHITYFFRIPVGMSFCVIILDLYVLCWHREHQLHSH